METDIASSGDSILPSHVPQLPTDLRRRQNRSFICHPDTLLWLNESHFTVLQVLDLKVNLFDIFICEATLYYTSFSFFFYVCLWVCFWKPKLKWPNQTNFIQTKLKQTKAKLAKPNLNRYGHSLVLKIKGNLEACTCLPCSYYCMLQVSVLPIPSIRCRRWLPTTSQRLSSVWPLNTALETVLCRPLRSWHPLVFYKSLKPLYKTDRSHCGAVQLRFFCNNFTYCRICGIDLWEMIEL